MPSADQSLITKCQHCGTKNRVSRLATAEKRAVCGRCRRELPIVETKPIVVTDANFDTVVTASELPVLLDLWAAWCGPCRLIAPVIESVAGRLAGRVLVGKLDVDANPATSARFGVQSIPTLLVLKNGREVDRMVGVMTPEAILQRLSHHL